jgi:hypothetical protein
MQNPPTVSGVVALSEPFHAGIDLIVMGTHGRTGVERLVLGSVAEKVLRDASCSVLDPPGRRRAHPFILFLAVAANVAYWCVLPLYGVVWKWRKAHGARAGPCAALPDGLPRPVVDQGRGGAAGPRAR